MPKVCHNPGKDRDVIQNYHVAIVDQAEAYAFEALLYVVVGYGWSSTISLTDGDLERQTRDA